MKDAMQKNPILDVLEYLGPIALLYPLVHIHVCVYICFLSGQIERDRKERRWINRLATVVPQGLTLNRMD